MTIPTATMNDDEMLTRLLPIDLLHLSPEQIERATALGQSAEPRQAWQTYLTAMALMGLEQWLQERAPSLPFRSEWLGQGSAMSRSAILPESIGRVTLNNFQVQIVITEDITNGITSLAKAAVDQRQPDLYLLLEVLEELAQVRVQGYLPVNRLTELTTTQALELEDEQNYALPLNWFEPKTGKLLLYLQYMQPQRVPATAALQQRVINAGRWLVNQLDQAAQDLGWVLLPPTPSLAMRTMRSSSEQLNRVLTDLIERREIELPPQFGHAYQEIQLDGVALLLYSVVWELPGAETPDWILLTIVGRPDGTAPPLGLRLQIEDAATALADTTLADGATYLYAQVVGGQDEQFRVRVSLGSEQTERLFGFNNAS